MLQSLYFASTHKLHDSDLRIAFPMGDDRRIQWVQEISEAIPGDSMIGILTEKGGEFPLHYELHIPSHDRWTLRQKVEGLKKLSTSTNASFLIDHDGSNPYLFVQIEPGGQTCVVGVDVEPYNDLDQLTVEGIYNEGIGIIGLYDPLGMEEKAAIAPLFFPEYRFLIIQEVEPGMVDGNFREAQQVIEVLTRFRHFYLLVPDQKAPWYSADERSEKLQKAMELWNQITHRDVCLFPPNGETIENIPGGSDSERFCVVVSVGGIQKVIYKRRRDKWE